MKRAFFFFTIALCAISLKAQDSIVYRSIFGDSTTSWMGTGIYNFDGADRFCLTSRFGDTAVIEGLKYNILRDNYFATAYYCNRVSKYYVRESDSKDKIYLRYVMDYFPPDSVTAEILVMDLSLNVGDTLNTKSWLECSSLGVKPAPRIMIDSIFYMDGRKMMRTSCMAEFQSYGFGIIKDTLYFIEGVGPSMGIGYAYYATEALYGDGGILPLWTISPSVWCHFSDSTRDFHYTNYYSINYALGPEDCGYSEIIGIRERERPATEIYPNPAQDKITIDGTFSPQSRYRIISSDGKTALDGTLSNGSNTITIADLRKGIYLISIEDNGNKTIKKFVKL